MNHALQHIDWGPCLFEPHPDRALETYARQRQGVPPPSIRYFSPVPWLARATIDMHPEYGLLMHLDQNTADLVALVVSQENSCRFCYAAVRALLWVQGMSTARIQQLEQDAGRADLPPRALAAIAFARAQSRSGPPRAREAVQALRAAGFTDHEMREIAYAVAITDFSNRVHTIASIPLLTLEHLPDRLHTRLLRPVLRWMLRRTHSRGRPTPLGRLPSYPYARLMALYEGSPIGPMLGRTLEEMWASPHLTPRCKLLMLAVIARGLGCEACADEIGEALRAQGLSEATIVQVLAHLHAPELDETERLLVPFARETIWYEPSAVQRRAWALRDRLSNLQLIEAIGVAALANGLCRMGAMVMDHP